MMRLCLSDVEARTVWEAMAQYVEDLRDTIDANVEDLPDIQNKLVVAEVILEHFDNEVRKLENA